MKISYGNGNICELPLADAVTVRAHAARTLAGERVAIAVQQAFAQPLDYPDLPSATVPGDTVAIALEHGTPQMLQVVAGTLSALQHAGVESASITILLAAEFAGDDASQHALRELAGDEVTVVVHGAEGEYKSSLLGVTKAGLPLRLNRILCDADLVIPIGPSRGNEDELLPDGMLYPRFADQETLSRFRATDSHDTSHARQKLLSEIEECEWLLGIGLALQVVPAPNDGIVGLYCGTPKSSTTAAREQYHEVWSADVSGRADLVVATIVGNDSQQTWQNLSRVLAIAEELVEPGGAIAICSEIAVRPGPSGKRLRNAQDLAAVERKILTDNFADSAAALVLCRMLQRGTIYLKSQLDGAYVESLGLAPIRSDQELERLTNAYPRCLVLEEAQRLEPKLVNA